MNPSAHADTGQTVLVTVVGDARSCTVEADPAAALGDLLPSWAAQCSTDPAAQLVVLAGEDNPTLMDLDATLTGQGLGYGSVLHLLAAADAAAVLQPAAAVTADPASAGVAARPAAAGAGVLPGKVPAAARMIRALRAALTPAAAPAVAPVGEFGKAPAAPSPAARWRQAMADTDRAGNLERMIRAAPLTRCQVIAVVSPKGGAGKTTITALLGMLLAELRRDPVLAIDANPDFGNLQDKLGAAGQNTGATDEFYDWLAATPAATPADLAARLGAGPHGLRYLPTPTGSLQRMVAAADFDLYQALIARLRDYQGLILIDCGTGLLDPPVRAALAAADQILLVTDSSADTAGLVVRAARYLPAGTPTWLVANKMPPRGAMVDLDRVATAIGQLAGVTVVPEQRLTENIVTPGYDWSTGPAGWQEPLRELAARLAGDWATRP